MKEITLINGRGIAIVDDEDYSRLSQYKWYRNQRGYAVRNDYSRKQPTVFMHRDILGEPPEGYEVDHRNRNPLDNRKSNIRFATHSQNIHNRAAPKRNTPSSSRFRGVVRHHRGQFWVASIRYQGKSIHLGCRKDEVEAAKLYDETAKQYFGEFANLNFPEGDNE